MHISKLCVKGRSLSSTGTLKITAFGVSLGSAETANDFPARDLGNEVAWQLEEDAGVRAGEFIGFGKDAF